MSNKEIISVSVIVPVFNTAEYLTHCIESLLNQTIKIEIICVDNGSTDGSYELLKNFSERFSNVLVLKQIYGRQGDARNLGLKYAKGKYVGFVDSDDFVSKEMFEILYKFAENKSADVSICGIDIFYNESEVIEKKLNHKELLFEEPFDIRSNPSPLRNLTICNKLFSKQLLNKFQLKFPSNLVHEDQYFVTLALLLSKKIILTSDSLYFYRKGRIGSVSQDGGPHAFDIFKVFDLIKQKIDNREEFLEVFNELKVLRLIQLSNTLKGNQGKEYFKRMQVELKELQIQSDSVKILKINELREFLIIKYSNYFVYQFYVFSRLLYGEIRRIFK